MAPGRATTGSTSGSRSSQFKPPRSNNPSTKASSSTGKGPAAAADEDDDEDDDELDDTRRRGAGSSGGATDQMDMARIPTKLLTRLLHDNFDDERTRISKDANAAVSKYMETFVREAIARAAHERGALTGASKKALDGFLEVEDLEKLAPQLLLDF
ncbi:MAG: hypothetical protein M1814_004642 [Vezdaea aestivalis]|nr:MAG: hypothetical protein M1814_004642 [Vezdaea aestivalis]